MFTSRDLQTYWAIERLKLEDGRFAYIRLPQQIDIGFVVAGVTKTEASVLIPIRADDFFAESQDLRTSLRRIVVNLGDGPSNFVQIACLDESLERVFSQLCVDLIAAVKSSPMPGVEVRKQYDRWRALFAGRRSEGMTHSQLVGLFGELQTLLDILELSCNRNLDMWVGPNRAVHDFEFHDHYLEVKSTTSRNELIVEIHGLGQLDCPDGADLHLVVHRLLIAQDGRSLEDQVERLVELGVDRIELYEKLLEAGYDWAEAPNPAAPRFRIEESRCYRVDGSFPRIVPSSFGSGSVPDGVIRLVYSLDLTSPACSQLEDIERRALYGGFSE